MAVQHAIAPKIKLFKIFFIGLIILFIYSAELFSARIQIYVNCFNLTNVEVRFLVREIEIVSLKGKSYSFKIDKVISSDFSNFLQQYMATLSIPTGIYVKLKIKIESPFLNNKKLDFIYLPIELPTNIQIKKGETTSIFLQWDVKGSIKGKKFIPIVFVKKQDVPLRGEILFVTSDDENILYIIRVDTNQITSVMDIPKNPKEMALSCFDDKVYIISKENRTVTSVEVSTFRKIDSFIVPFVVFPEFIQSLPEKRFLIVDPDYNKLIIIDRETGRLFNNVKLGDGLSDIIYWSEGRKIFISSYNEETVYVLDEALNVVSKIKTNGSPRNIYIIGNYLYISNFDSDILSIFDLTFNRFIKNIRVDSPANIVGWFDRIFISNMKGKKIEVLYRNQNNIIKSIVLPGEPDRLTLCVKRGWLYVTLKKRNEIAVIDILKEEFIGSIILGSIPYDIKVGRENNYKDICQ